jgi:hypothetical protein
MKSSKMPCKHECHDQHPDSQDNRMARPPKIEPANSDH